MTKKQNKIAYLHRYENLPLSHEIVYNNGYIVKLYNKVDNNILLNGTKKDIIKAYRQYLNKNNNNNKHVTIKYKCNVFSTVTKSWHDINEILASGYYNNIKNILIVVNKKRQVNNNKYIKNLQFYYEFKNITKNKTI